MSDVEAEVTRGVRNPRVVDLITVIAATSSIDGAGTGAGDEIVVLKMVEDRPFGSDPNQAGQLEEKFNNYLDYVLDGWFHRQYPQHTGKPVHIELVANSEPDEQLRGMIAEMSRYAERVGMRFQLQIES